MHHTFKTEGFVLGGTGVGEGHRSLALFTRELGLVYATARSVRESRSKLRYSLQDLSYSKLSLVQGKEQWRITGAQEIYSLYHRLSSDREKLQVATRVLLLLRRLLQGEEKHEALFGLLVAGMQFLREKEADREMLQNFEYVLVLRMLALLGYIGENEKLSELLQSSPFDEESLSKMSPLRTLAVREINTALRESQL